MDNKGLSLIIKDTFEVEPEVLEVASYALATLAISDIVLQSLLNKEKEVRGIPPETYHLMKRFDSGLTVNQFWIDNYAPIKMQLSTDEVKLATLRGYMEFIRSKPSHEMVPNALHQMRSIILSRYDVLTTIAFLWKGVTYAESFDSKYRLAVQLSKEHNEFFDLVGI